MHEPNKTPKNLALFDFDGTLCTKDSFTGFIFYALRKRHIVRQGLKILPWIQGYYLNLYPAHAMRPKLYRAMFSESNAFDVQRMAAEYAHTLLAHLNPELLRQLQRHQALGDDVVIVSASVDIYLKPICELLNVQLICTEPVISNGQYTGHYATLDCSCEQKKQRILKQFDLSQYDSVYAYGNSYEDLEMLSLADYTYMAGESTKLPPLESLKKMA
ncbi:HAD-IB family hydrolase [Acinetobacter sp.]|jgi:HAD superfamily hydrolase (TIGR01490 family)|uniref:HAD-IB family hydrolase n=1 Tax=Acinetobacter sp. TaxID=472 RepID=UPI0035B229D1